MRDMTEDVEKRLFRLMIEAKNASFEQIVLSDGEVWHPAEAMERLSLQALMGELDPYKTAEVIDRALAEKFADDLAQNGILVKEYRARVEERKQIADALRFIANLEEEE